MITVKAAIAAIPISAKSSLIGMLWEVKKFMNSTLTGSRKAPITEALIPSNIINPMVLAYLDPTDDCTTTDAFN